MPTVPSYNDGDELPSASWNLAASILNSLQTSLASLQALINSGGLTFPGAATIRQGGSTLTLPVVTDTVAVQADLTALQAAILAALPVEGATSLGAGQAVYSGLAAQILQFKSLLAGQGITLSSDATTITITGVSWSITTGLTQAAAADHGYVANNAARIAYTLPVAPAAGSVFYVTGRGFGGWRILPGAGQSINVGLSASGAAGYIQSENQFDGVLLVYLGGSQFNVIACIGNIRVFNGAATTITNASDGRPFQNEYLIANTFTYPAAGGATLVQNVAANTVYQFASHPNGSVTKFYLAAGSPDALSPFSLAQRILKVRIYYGSNTAGAGQFDVTIKCTADGKADSALADFLPGTPTHSLPDALFTQDILTYEATADASSFSRGPCIFEITRTGGTSVSALRVLAVEFVYASQ